MPEHVIDPAIIHHRWQLALEPALTIRSGDTVHYDLRVSGHGNIWPGATFAEARFDLETAYSLSGPVYVEGAERGDTLEIEILALTPGPWGWTAILPGSGLLADAFPDGYLRTFDLSGGERAELAPGVEVPLTPFLGTMGNHPGEPDGELPFPPHRGGGNIDNRHLGVGAVLWLPVWCEGALFSCGDPHATQGDGEVCVSALECPMRASLRFTLHRRSIPVPQFTVPGPLTSALDGGGYHATMGIDADLMNGARQATRAMVSWVNERYGLAEEDAYILCSLAGDLKILEIVDAGVWNVAMTMPLNVFTTDPARPSRERWAAGQG